MKETVQRSGQPTAVYSGTWEGAWNGLRTAGNAAYDEEALQAAFSARLADLNKEESVQWVDTHASGFDGEKPDLSCVASGAAVSECNCIAVIELKDRASELGDALRQLVARLAYLYKKQPRRTTAKGLLFNASSAIELCCTRTAEADEFDWSMTEEKTEDAAWNLLRGFMTSSAADLGACEPIKVNGRAFVTTRRVGRGGSCVVYAVEDTGNVENAVIKIYNKVQDRKTEEERLASFVGGPIAGCVPKVVASEEQHLVVTPFAQKFERDEFFAEHAAHLMSILKHIHTVRRLVHRDVRPANFFNVPQADGRPGVLLNDWASSAPVGVKVGYAGSPGRYKAPWLPRDGSLYKPQPKDDLYSFVVSCYSLTYRNA
eukprot:Rhum_TRINITY_DN14823_c1_g1::Rhum_TRINITY_DN14823_c1_g1_i1::g.120371::m.120371